MESKFTVVSRDTNGVVNQKSFGNITKAYITQIGGQVADVSGDEEITPTSYPSVKLPYPPVQLASYQTFWHWADAVARALYTLSTNTYVTSTVSTTWDVAEEVSE